MDEEKNEKLTPEADVDDTVTAVFVSTRDPRTRLALPPDPLWKRLTYKEVETIEEILRHFQVSEVVVAIQPPDEDFD